MDVGRPGMREADRAFGAAVVEVAAEGWIAEKLCDPPFELYPYRPPPPAVLTGGFCSFRNLLAPCPAPVPALRDTVLPADPYGCVCPAIEAPELLLDSVPPHKGERGKDEGAAPCTLFLGRSLSDVTLTSEGERSRYGRRVGRSSAALGVVGLDLCSTAVGPVGAGVCGAKACCAVTVPLGALPRFVPLIELCALLALVPLLPLALAAFALLALTLSCSALSVRSGVGDGEGIRLGLSVDLARSAPAEEGGRVGVGVASTYRFPEALAVLRGWPTASPCL